jgi:photosystem II stability/assembly factor-like uncharacterized protein
VVAGIFLYSRSGQTVPPLTSSQGTSQGAYVGSDLHSIAVDPNDPRHIFVGGHEAAAESLDGGHTFQPIAGLRNADPMSWVISPDGQQMVTSGHYGVRLSRDGGRSWTDLTSHLPYSDVHALGVDPGTPSHWWAYAVGRGVYSSTDAGQSWSSRTGGSISLMGPILVFPGGERLLAADTQQGIVRSVDGGRSWTRLAAFRAAFLSSDPKNPEHVVATGDGASESLDGGLTWHPLRNLPANARAVASSPDGSLYAGAVAGPQAQVYRSTDGGANWSRLSG